jgi:uncharacterized membrane protein
MAAAGHDVTRIEAFSDAVFGFAITLLVVSLEVPDDFDALVQILRGLPLFAITFAVLLNVWQEHHTFFQRFGSSDGVTIWLNGALLFVVVAYIYPLKFLFAVIAGPKGLVLNGGTTSMLRPGQFVTLLLVYGIGYVTIFTIFAVLYRRAATRAVDAGDRQAGLKGIGHSFVYVGIGVLSMAIAFFGGPSKVGLAGMSYGLLGPAHGLYRWMLGRRERRAAVTPPERPESASS